MHVLIIGAGASGSIAAKHLAENGFDASAVVPSPKSARFCSAAGVVPTQPDPS